jgi:4-amino-4-deoxychorismate lyase
LYNTTLQNIEYIPYQEKEIKTLAIVETNLIYNYKYANRDAINELATLNSDMDDILIVQDGYIQDTSIANIAFYDSTTWFTPSQPLLKGTMREKLIDEGFLQVKAIKKEDLYKYSQVALMNAMIGFRVLKNITIYDKVGKVYDY